MLRRRLLDYLLAAWAAVVLFRFCAPFAGLQSAALSIETSRLHVVILGGCLALAAIEAALDAVKVADRKV
jgi:hypothetical protein